MYRVDNFWPWANNKGEKGTKYYGKQHFRDTAGNNIAAPRDGIPRDSNDAATDTITDTEASAIPNTVETRRFGMQESYDYYQDCQHTERNKGLYTADQRVNRNDRRGTRQNPNGNRHGFECNEERDYYPWWAPSPWIDIAVLTDNAANKVCHYTDPYCTKRCEYYMNNTMNFHKKGYCDVDHSKNTSTVTTKLTSTAWTNRVWYNNRAACEKAKFKWYEVSHADNIKLSSNSFVCAKTQFARVNQLGNARADTVVSQTEYLSQGVVANQVVEGVNANRFLWTVPNIPTNLSSNYFSPNMASAYKSCVLRIRYNISSADFPAWPKDAVDPGSPAMVDYHNNSKSSSDRNTPLHQNPYVYLNPGDSSSKGNMFVKLKVNTNQYSRTFQDRSYVFSIKPLPTVNKEANNTEDTPKVDAVQMQANLAAGGKIYNVNVRGKRGNIVQVYPSVEYDFVPNMLSLSTKDMIHFQWTGSDYNPRRGCNDATGGPPDANTFFTSANANQNPRADRSNVVLTSHMGNNVPLDYLGYDHSTTSLSYSQEQAIANMTTLSHAPCYNHTTDSTTTATDCLHTMLRLAYLNQQSDVGSLQLRQGKNCLTETELNQQTNEDVADFHPLNCAKMNAKPFPYFDGGILFLRKLGWFPFFSSRNNNFSNRQNIGVICVGPKCKVDNTTGVLQDTNPNLNSKTLVRNSPSTCFDSSGLSGSQSNANGVNSCVYNASNPSNILQKETFTTPAADNDNVGSGNAQGCASMSAQLSSVTSSSSSSSSTSSIQENLTIAFVLLAVGIVFSCIAFFLYRRYQVYRAGESKFRYEKNWLSAEPVDGTASVRMKVGRAASPVTARPASLKFSENNPGIKLSRATTAINTSNSPSLA